MRLCWRFECKLIDFSTFYLVLSIFRKSNRKLKGKGVYMNKVSISYGAGSIDIGTNIVYWCENVNEMIESNLVVNDIVYTKGRNTASDGGGAQYVISGDNNLKSNLGTIIGLSNNLFAKLVLDSNGVINSKVFNIFPNEGVDVADKLNLMFTELDAKVKGVFFDSGVYLVNKIVKLTSLYLYGDYHNRPVFSIMNTFTEIALDDNFIVYNANNSTSQRKELGFENIVFSVVSEKNSVFETTTVNKSTILVKIVGKVASAGIGQIDSFTAKSCKFSITPNGYGMQCTCLDLRNALDHITIEDCEFENTTGATIGGCLWLRTDYNSYIKNVTIRNNRFVKDGNDEALGIWANTGTSASSLCENIYIDRNQFVYNSTTVRNDILVAVNAFTEIRQSSIRDNSFFINYQLGTVIGMNDIVTFRNMSIHGNAITATDNCTLVSAIFDINGAVPTSEPNLEDRTIFIKNNIIHVANSLREVFGNNFTRIISDNNHVTCASGTCIIERQIQLVSNYAVSCFEAVGSSFEGMSLIINEHKNYAYTAFRRCYISVNNCTIYINNENGVADILYEDNEIEVKKWSPLIQIAATLKNITGLIKSFKFQRNSCKGAYYYGYQLGESSVVDVTLVDNIFYSDAKEKFGNYTPTGIYLRAGNKYTDTIANEE